MTHYLHRVVILYGPWRFVMHCSHRICIDPNDEIKAGLLAQADSGEGVLRGGQWQHLGLTYSQQPEGKKNIHGRVVVWVCGIWWGNKNLPEIKAGWLTVKLNWPKTALFPQEMWSFFGLHPSQKVQFIIRQQQNLLHDRQLYTFLRGDAETGGLLEHGHRASLQW